jgi:hypothetical protein
MLCYGSEASTVKKKDEIQITACEMGFMQRTAGYTRWDWKWNEDVMKELHIEPVLDYIQHYQKQWKNHLTQMRTPQIPKLSFTVDQTEHGLWAIQWKDDVKILLWDCNSPYGLEEEDDDDDEWH